MLQQLLVFVVPCLFVLPVHRDAAGHEEERKKWGVATDGGGTVGGELPVDEDDQIEWSASRKLTWRDFTGRPDPNSPNAALTNSSINIEYGYDKNGLKHTIKCRFNKSKSWVRVKNDYILNHEQRHFDIAEVHARALYKEMQAYRFNSRTVDADIHAIYGRVVQAHVETQQQYDLQTRHSLDSLQQGEWNHRIDSMLHSLEEFAGYR